MTTTKVTTMTSNADIYRAVIGAMPFIYPWWTAPVEHCCPDWFDDSKPDSFYSGWRIEVGEVTDVDDESLNEIHILTPAKLRKAAQTISDGGPEEWNRDFYSACYDLIHNYDECDFDSITADWLIQHALFGECRYG